MEDSPAGAPNPKRVAAAKAYHDRRKKKASGALEEGESSWYEAHGNKVVKKTRRALGVHSEYFGTRKQADQQKLKYTVK